MSEMNIDVAPQAGAGEQKIDENDRIINSMQTMREKFIGQLAVNGKLPSDKEDRQVLLSLMDGATRTALAGKKIKADEKATVSQAQMVANLAEAVRIARSNASAALRSGGAPVREVPKREVHLVPGHTDTGDFPVSTSAIMNASPNREE